MKKTGLKNFIETKKDVVKIVRSSLELLSLIVILILVIKAMFFFKDYEPYDEKDPSIVSGEDHGFIALSYLGVDRDGSDTLITTKRLKEELETLHNLGYVTITQQDIHDYYYEGKALPDKALYLMFEDGRKDTAMFAEKLLEEFNYIATIMTYASNLEIRDSTFLTPKDIKKLVKSGYCELGTNGYRLAYINAYDRHDRFLGQLTAKEYVKVRPFLRRDYNHYLMDFIRDENRIPVESSSQMRQRIDYDYEKMKEVYTKEFGRVPLAYVLMQANTGRFGDNDKVSDENRKEIGELFKLNFNREGFSLNDSDVDEYDLTRMQPQAYWYVNHLLMRIKDDLKEDEKDWISFVTGDEKRAGDWEVTCGAAEFKKNLIALTSEPSGYGLMKLKKEDPPENMYISAELTGNVLGEQAIALRCDEEENTALKISLQDNHILIRNGVHEGDIIFDYDLHDLVPSKDRKSVEEDDAEAYEAELGARSQFSEDMKEAVLYYYEGVDARTEGRRDLVTYDEGGEEYVPEFDLNDRGDRKLCILLSDDTLSVTVDGKLIADRIDVREIGKDGKETGLLSGIPDGEYSQRNLTDDVYDGAFLDLKIFEAKETEGLYEKFAAGKLKESDKSLEVWYDNSLRGIHKALDKGGKVFNAVINWFVKNL